jgi:hypothetical protein
VKRATFLVNLDRVSVRFLEVNRSSLTHSANCYLPGISALRFREHDTSRHFDVRESETGTICAEGDNFRNEIPMNTMLLEGVVGSSRFWRNGF